MVKIHHRTYDKHRVHYDRIDDALDGQDAVQENAQVERERASRQAEL